MAEWGKVAKAFALADGHITQKEVRVLRNEVLADGAVSNSEMDFLLEIKVEAKSSVRLLVELIDECQAMLSGKNDK